MNEDKEEEGDGHKKPKQRTQSAYQKKNGWINPGPDRFKKEEEDLPSIIM